jgi:hypothetical protein
MSSPKQPRGSDAINDMSQNGSSLLDEQALTDVRFPTAKVEVVPGRDASGILVETSRDTQTS